MSDSIRIFEADLVGDELQPFGSEQAEKKIIYSPTLDMQVRLDTICKS